MFIIFKGKNLEKLGLFTVLTATLEFARSGIDEILGALVIRWQDNDFVLYIVGAISWIAASSVVYILFSKTKLS